MIATGASRRSWLRAALLSALAAASPLAGRASAAEAPLTLALTPSRDPTALQEAGDAFAKAITKLSGVPIRAQVASDYAGVIEAVRSRRVDLAFVHPVGYVLANREAGCQILVRDVWQGKTAYTARFYVRKASGIEKVEDLRGQDRGLRRSSLELRVHLPDGAPDQARAREGPRPENLLQGRAVRGHT